jgi:uncharacterized protein YbbK (DUF523 family)
MISACLLGFQCRYDGGHAGCIEAADLVGPICLIPFCPEQMGGLPTPRSPSTIINGDGKDVLEGRARVVNAEGEDVTAAFLKGAQEAVKLARLTGASLAVLKDRSPSCGLKTPHCEKRQGFGAGVTAALFQSLGITMLESGRGGRLAADDLRKLTAPWTEEDPPEAHGG